MLKSKDRAAIAAEFDVTALYSAADMTGCVATPIDSIFCCSYV